MNTHQSIKRVSGIDKTEIVQLIVALVAASLLGVTVVAAIFLTT